MCIKHYFHHCTLVLYCFLLGITCVNCQDSNRALRYNIEKGRELLHKGDAPQALKYYLKALDKCNTSRSERQDSLLLEDIYSEIGYLYYEEGLYLRSVEMAGKALNYSLTTNDQTQNLLLKGRSYLKNHQTDSASLYLHKALSLCPQENIQLKTSVIDELATVYLEEYSYAEAKACLLHGDQKSSQFRLNMANYYMGLNQPDSAKLYLENLKVSSDFDDRIEAYSLLSQMAADDESPDSALYYRNLQMIYQQNKEVAEADLQMMKLNKLYDYIVDDIQIDKLKNSAATQQITTLAAVFIACLFLIFLCLYRERTVRLQREKEIKISNLKHIEEENKRKSQLYIQNLKSMISSLEDDIAKLKDSKDHVAKELLEARKELMQKDIEQAEALQEMEQKAASSLVNTEVYRRIVAPNYRMKDIDWSDLAEAIDYSYPNFTTKLNELYRFKTAEYNLCLLLKAEIQLSQISNLLVTSKQNVSSMRKRLYKKVLKGDEAPECWDRFVRCL